MLPVRGPAHPTGATRLSGSSISRTGDRVRCTAGPDGNIHSAEAAAAVKVASMNAVFANVGVFRAGMMRACPVRGCRPLRAARHRTANVPKPTSRRGSPRRSAA